MLIPSFLKQSLIKVPNVLRYKPLIISGCSGAGKTCLINFLISHNQNQFQLNPSYTTRSPRPGQIPGIHYIFSHPQQFKKLQSDKAFIQSFNVHGNMYGTHLEQVNQIRNKGKVEIFLHQVCLLDLDVQGGEEIHKRFPDWNFLFIRSPSLQALRSRLISRNTQSAQVIENRLKNGIKELKKLQTLKFYSIIINEDLERTKEELKLYLKKKYNLKL